MINKIDNLTKKSFNNYTGPEKSFKEKNIIFGYNGQGKSTLAQGLYEQGLEMYGESNIRLFDRNYIKNNMLLDESTGEIKGVALDFSAENIHISKEIEKLETNLKDLEESVGNLEEEKNNIVTETKNEINRIHDERKGNTRIQKKQQSLPVDEIYNAYIKDKNRALELGSTLAEIEHYRGDDFFEKQLDKINNISINTIKFTKFGEIDKIRNICETTIDDIEIPSQDIINWLEQGLIHHRGKDTCEFCQNEIEYDKISNRIQELINSKKQQYLKHLNDHLVHLENFVKQIEEVLKEENLLLELIGNVELKKHFDYLSTSKDEITKIRVIIKEKLEEPYKNLDVGESFIYYKKHINDSELTVEKIRKIIRNRINDLNTKINNLNVLAKGAIGFEIEKNSLIKRNLKTIENLRVKIKDSKLKIEKINISIREYEKQKSSISDFSKLLSNTLRRLNLGFKLELDQSNNSYVLQHEKSTQVLTVDDISEGEKNLFGLLYFYYELFKDNDQKRFKDNIKLLILDDPISSLDSSNRFFVLEIIDRLLRLKGIKTQMFIFTHVWEDFFDLSYNKQRNPLYGLFEVRKNIEGYSKIYTKKVGDRPYQTLFKEVYEFTQKEHIDQDDRCEMYHMPNIVRKVLEEFISFKSAKNVLATNRYQNTICEILDIESNEEKYMIAQLLSMINSLSHRTVAIDMSQLIRCTKFLLERIKVVDEYHYHAMLGKN